jgi:hypothetical protein
MKKILLIAAIAFVVIGGTATVMTVDSQTALADGCSGSGC